jgi:CHRD domain/PEP-CTERM motif
VVLDAAAHTIQINVTFSGLTSNTTAAHIHCCLPSPLSTENVGVATTLPAFPGFPLGVTAGTYSSQVFDLTMPLIYNPAFVTAQGGLAQAETALEAGIENAETYLNIHTVNFGGGEIRGILQAVPEPSTLLLAGTALVGLVGYGWRQRKRVA